MCAGKASKSKTKYLGEYYGVWVYSNPMFNDGSALSYRKCIYVGEDVWDNPCKGFILQHEFGHYLQYTEMGSLKYLLHVGIPSIWSSWHNKAQVHNRKHYEIDANIRAYNYFNKPDDWNIRENPLSN
jgi:hypothetical protein